VAGYGCTVTSKKDQLYVERLQKEIAPPIVEGDDPFSTVEAFTGYKHSAMPIRWLKRP
jgi:hypothetical protein